MITTLRGQLARLFTATCLSAMMCTPLQAQDVVEGTAYFLPRTAIHYALLIERTTTQPGELCMYADRFLKKKDVAFQPSTSYRILSITSFCTGIRDTAKHYVAAIDQKHSIQSLKVNDDGIIAAVNGDARPVAQHRPFEPAPKPEPLNPRDFMNQDILTAGSSAKTAELAAQEIYDIRDSRNQLSRGQADQMPKDGEQLRLMMANLDTQERALLQLFEGTTERDTTEVIVTFVPEKEVQKHLLFRFSKRLGLVDADDLSGAPCYVSVEDLHSMPANSAVADEGKRGKDDANIFVTMPGKIRVRLFNMQKELATQELYAAQFGKSAPLDNELFGKKLFTRLVYNTITGSVESINTDMIKK